MNLKFIIHILFLIIFDKIKSATIKIIDNYSEEKYNDYYYLKSYKIPKTMMRFRTNTESFWINPIEYAFDDDFDAYWESYQFQENSFHNSIEITFSKIVTIDKMLYQALSTDQYQGIGYPTELRIYYKLRNPDGSLSDDPSDYLLIEDIISEPTGDKVLFIFDDIIICDQIKLEWFEIEQTQAPYSYPIANEIMFFAPENEYVNKLLFEVFINDYTKLNINPECNLFIIDELDEKLKEYSDIYDNFKELIIRARKLISGELKYEKRREFTTNQTSDLNIINQHGDLNSYSNNILKMSRGSTDRQPTGIFGFSNETIKIYVDANKNDPLPSIVFTQYVGIYNKWIESPIVLKKGVNILKVDIFDISDIKLNIRPGGPIYIENKFTSDEQSQNVKIYIEGGTLFPYFRLNDDEIIFKKYLNEYYLNLKKCRDKCYDIAELYSQNILITVNASYANKVYNKKEKSPQENLLNWDKLLRILFIFDGIQFEEDQPYYDVKNQYITIHIRYSQNYRSSVRAYAYDDHIGIFNQNELLKSLVSYEGIGGTLTHEIGHMIDVRPREYPERTNVVLEEYAVQTIYKQNYNRRRHEIIYDAIAPDNIDNKLRYCYQDEEYCDGFFSNAGDYIYPQYVWWDIESFYPGYWGKLNNLYRYNYSLIGGMTSNEAMIFLTNLILGFDTGYYFERFGLAMSYNPFTISGASSRYNNSMKEAINEGKISNNTIIKKLWYADSEQYNYTLNNGTGCYKDKNEYDIKINNITLTSRGYRNISLPFIDCIGHLGFEILENGTVIGFTNKLYFKDKNKYPDDYTPRYKIIAYDRLLDYKEST